MDITKKIKFGEDEKFLEEAVSAFRNSRKRAAITGAGISVGSGIPDFRSPGGLWTVFTPDEYAILDVFMANPEKAWKLYRAIGLAIKDKKPNPAHIALADLEKKGLLDAIITQNIDNLHHLAGNKNIVEVHGDHQHLECLWCGIVREGFLLVKNVR